MAEQKSKTPRVRRYSVPVFARAAILQILLPKPLELNRIRAELGACDIHLLNGSLYPALHALVDDKLLREVAIEGATTPGYTLTAQGRAEATKHRLTLSELLRRSVAAETSG